ncbi:MAG: hypothetical protein GWP08_04930 [Nitrospiraceae bacterium]|nr:hypothetical protein [Nitrospiraceae bacterium]
MSIISRKWRTWKHGRKFTKIGKGCRFPGKRLTVDGHVELGDHCRIRDNVILRTNDDGRIVFGERSGCSFYCIFEATELIQIGARTGIAEFTVIRDSHHMVIGTDRHWRLTPLVAQPVIIGTDCLIGSGCYIMPGVTIGDGAVIQARSLVQNNVGPYEVWAGNPARRLCHRTENVPAPLLRQCQKLMEEHGFKEDRYVADPKAKPGDPRRGDRIGAGDDD